MSTRGKQRVSTRGNRNVAKLARPVTSCSPGCARCHDRNLKTGGCSTASHHGERKPAHASCPAGPRCQRFQHTARGRLNTLEPTCEEHAFIPHELRQHHVGKRGTGTQVPMTLSAYCQHCRMHHSPLGSGHPPRGPPRSIPSICQQA
jgi:hypothetical protein